MSGALLNIENLKVDFTTEDGLVHAVKGIDLSVRAGEVLALVGESGSGKSVTAMAVLQLLPKTAQITGSVEFDGRDLLACTESEMNGVRGAQISMVFQEPMTALNPSMRIGAQITEAIRNHREVSAEVAWDEAVELLGKVGIPEPAIRAKSYPHELSGGQRQRVVIAIALACGPQLIIADEPTTALDVTVQAEILDLIRSLARDTGTAFLLVTHNMGVVADIADRVAVMFRGDMVEVGDVSQVLMHPEHDYTKKLLSVVPRLPEALPEAAAAGTDPVLNTSEPAVTPALEFTSACVTYKRGGKSFQALTDVSLSIAPGEIVGLVGESGSGKSTLGRAALGLLPLSGGSMSLLGTDLGGKLGRREERTLRSRVGAIFQDPGSSLDPRMSIGEAIAEPLIVHKKLHPMSAAARAQKVGELLEAVELPANYASRYPHELSGGQRQRIGLARAIALEPELIIADEPTSALDVSVQAAVLDVLKGLQEQFNFACLFISHDLAVVESFSDRVAVMLQGELVEVGSSAEVLLHPQHAYSRRLLAAVPVPDPAAQRERRISRAALLAASK
ncbi:ABC transporter ATP-binding protein [Leucobacter sp. HY1908]